MPKDPFLLVSLEENESKALAQVISNDTARKILDILSKHESLTETDVAKKLDVPLSTVHYNLQALSKANLVKAEEFHYSEKGKEVLHYSLANKIIIIAPKKASTESFKDKLKSILPISIIVLVVGALIQVLTRLKFGAAKMMAGAPSLAAQAGAGAGGALDVAEKAVENIVEPAADEGARLMMTTAGEAAQNITENITQNITQNVTEQITQPAAQPIIQVVQQTPPTNIALWFLIGAVFTIILLVIWYWFVTRKNQSK
jgi:DNA-binding transcriptional ArsR family regulator